MSFRTPSRCPCCEGTQWNRRWPGFVICHGCGVMTVEASFSTEQLRNCYQEDYFHGREYVDYLTDAPAQKKTLGRHLELVRRFVPRGARLLEAGCAYGFFLELIQDEYPGSVGLDIFSAGVAHAKSRGFDAREGNLLEMEIEERFDGICLWDTIEHLPQPFEFIERASQLLKPGGYCFLTTGDFGALLPRLQGLNWRQIHPPTHLFYFTRPSLRALCQRAGLEAVRFGTVSVHRRLGSALEALSRFRKDTMAGRVASVATRSLPNRVLNSSFAINLGDTLYLVAKKPSHPVKTAASSSESVPPLPPHKAQGTGASERFATNLSPPARFGYSSRQMIRSTQTLAAITIMMPLFCIGAEAQRAPAFQPNYDESKVPKYTLPDPLVMADGRKVTDAKTWQKKRRTEILELFKTHVYGRSPGRPAKMEFEVTSLERNALGGLATRKEASVFFTGKKDGPKMDILIYVPNDAKKRVPVFLGMNFEGNHTIHSDPGITLAKQWKRSSPGGAVIENRASAESRAQQASRWQVEKILRRGYAVATVFYGDVEPDFAEGWKLGVRGALSRAGTNTVFAPDDWGAIGAWAWGLSRALDYLETDKDIDAKRVAVIGHSRLGKTALWAGAQDERFAIVISNDSGCGGAALSMRQFGETVERINTSFPHWFCGNFKKYNLKEDKLPVDQHELIGLVAPRPVYVASAEEDRWADPRGEFLSAKNAEPVYRLFGKRGLGVDEMPSVNQPVGETIGYHIRTGKHDVTEYDWEQYLNFAARHFGN